MAIYTKKEEDYEPLVIHDAATKQPGSHLEENKPGAEEENSESSCDESPRHDDQSMS